MTDQLTLSHNELKALLKRCFEGIYGHSQDFEDMARAILWLECHGLGGVEMLTKALPRIETGHISQPILHEITSNHYRIDAKNGSLIPLLMRVCDLAVGLARTQGFSYIDIENVEDSEIIIAAGMFCVQASLAVSARWQEGIAFCSRVQAPVVYDIAGSNVGLKCGKTIEPPVLTPKHTTRMLASRCDKNNKVSLERGIQITKTNYDCLSVVANRVLVKASAASRLGAGA